MLPIQLYAHLEAIHKIFVLGIFHPALSTPAFFLIVHAIYYIRNVYASHNTSQSIAEFIEREKIARSMRAILCGAKSKLYTQLAIRILVHSRR